MHPLFPLLPALSAGFRHLVKDWRFLSPLIGLPVLAGFVVMTILNVFHLQSMLLWGCIIKIPADFITGVFLAIYTRHILFNEQTAHIANDPKAQNALALSTLLYTLINFLISGIAAFSLTFAGQLANPESTTLNPVVLFGSLASILIVVWIQRFQWLPVAAAAGYPVPDFLKFMGYGFALPVRIFALWIVASLPAFMIMSMAEEAVLLGAGAERVIDLTWPAIGLVFLVRALSATLTGIITTAASVYAIRHCMKGQNPNV